MKNLFPKFTLVALIVLSSASCSEDQTELSDPSEISLERYENLSTSLFTDFNRISIELINQNAKFLDEDVVLGITQEYYNNDPEKYEAFVTSYKSSNNTNAKVKEELTSFQKEATDEIIRTVVSLISLFEIEEYLDTEFNDYFTQDMSVEDKDFILTFIVSYKESLTFINANPDLFTTSLVNGRTNGWWDDWGKCAAGTVGGILTGGLGGAAIGSAVPIIGTITGGVVGAVGGGLTGAAAAC